MIDCLGFDVGVGHRHTALAAGRRLQGGKVSTMTAAPPAPAPVLEFEPATHTYTMAGAVIPSVTQILEATKISDFSHVPQDVLEVAQERGTAVHQACWFDDQNDLDESSLDPRLGGYLAAWRKFRAEQQITIRLIEERVYSTLGFAGTFDRLVTMPKWGEVMLDLKTGEQTAAWRIQLAAYVRGFYGNLAPKCRRGAVKLRDDGRYQLCWYEMRDMARDWNVFAGALTVYQYRKENGIL